MNKKDFEFHQQYFKTNQVPTIGIMDLPPGSRTLLYGYTLDRDAFHVYRQGHLLHVVVYNAYSAIMSHQTGKEFPVDRLAPSKRAYPEATDRVFAAQLQGKGQDPCFTTWDDERAEQWGAGPFYGLRCPCDQGAGHSHLWKIPSIVGVA